MKFHIFISLVCLCCMIAEADWQFEVIDGMPQIVPENQLRIVDGTHLCMTTYDKYGGNLYFAYLWDNKWTVEMIDGRLNSGFFNDLRIDTEGLPHVVYSTVGENGSKPMYALRDQDEWRIEQIAGAKESVENICLAVAPDKSVHCVYYDSTGTGALRYACKINQTWTETILDVDGIKPAISLKTNGDPFVVYTDREGSLKYAHSSETGWETHVLINGINVIDQPLLEVNKSDLCHILYHDESSEQLNLLTFNPDNHSMQTRSVCQNSLISDYASLTLDQYGNPHLVCYYYNNLYYSYLNTDQQLIGMDIDHGSIGSTIFTSIAVDDSDQVHLTYFSYLMDWYTYAKGKGISWAIDQIMEAPVFGEFSTIALDNSGNAHVAYFNESNSQLFYASNRTGSWQSESVDTITLNRPGCLDIDMDRNDNPWICYGDASENDFLRLATKPDDAWIIESFANQWPVSQCDMAVNDNQEIYIVLASADSSDLIMLSGTSGNWNQVLIDDHLSDNSFPKIQISPSGIAHISYQKNDALFHAIPGQPPVLMTTLGEIPTNHDMSIDPTSDVHFAFVDSNVNHLCHGRWNGTTWIQELIKVNANPGGALSMTPPLEGKANVFFRDPETEELIHAYHTGSSWSVSSMTSGVKSSSLDAALAQDRIRLLFFNGMPMLASSNEHAMSPFSCTIDMPNDVFYPGQPCYCDVRITNESNVTHFDVPFIFILHLYDTYFFYPAYDGFSYVLANLTPGETVIRTIPDFVWPPDAGVYNDALVFATLTNPDFSGLAGNPAAFSFDWHE